MSFRFIGLIAAASIAITAIGSAPARADDEDVARALAAILGLAIVGKVISDRKDRDHERRVDRVYPDRDPKPRPLPRRVHRDTKQLPGHCFRTFDTRRGVYRGFGRDCLQKSYRFANRLPRHCQFKMRGSHGPRYAYEARCLRREGYRLAHH